MGQPMQYWKELIRAGVPAVLTASDGAGEASLAYTAELEVDADGFLVYPEGFESSQINKNLVRSLWFDRRISVLVLDPELGPLELRGIPRRAIISGPRFEQAYRAAQNAHPDADLSTLWLIEVQEVISRSRESRQRDQDSCHPIVAHLDRFAVAQASA